MIFLLFTACGSNSTAAWQEQYDLGIQYLTDGDYSAAVVALTAAIETEPKMAALYIARGDAYSAWAEKTTDVALTAASDGETVEWSEITITAGDDSTYTLGELYENAINDYEEAIRLIESGEAVDDSPEELLQEADEKLQKIKDRFEESREEYTERSNGQQTNNDAEAQDEELVEIDSNIVYLPVSRHTSVKDYNKDGTLHTSYETVYEYVYDSDTRTLTSEYISGDGDSTVTGFYVYNEYGETTETVSYSSISGTIYSSYTYEYNTEGKIIHTHILRYNYNDGSFTSDRTINQKYNEDGMVIWKEQIVLDSNGNETRTTEEYEYDSNGNCIKVVEYNAEGLVESMTESVFDANGNIVSDITYIDGEVTGSTEYEYENGNLTKIITFDGVGNIIGTGNQEYDDAGNIMKYSYYDAEDTIVNYMEYNENGNITKTVLYDEDGNIDYVVEDEYDENGNVSVSISTSETSTTLVGSTTTTIYYDSVSVTTYEYLAVEFETR
ncbi:MAG: hypothetical protein LUI10_12330 [Lachnospiraceae bacterium]|nr:hypothetical protein [Lachnospiraceae bacterium]